MRDPVVADASLPTDSLTNAAAVAKRNPAFLTAGRDRQSGQPMGLAGTAVADKDDGLRPLDVSAFGGARESPAPNRRAS